MADLCVSGFRDWCDTSELMQSEGGCMLSCSIQLLSFTGTGMLVSSICGVAFRWEGKKEAALPGPGCASSVVRLASLAPVSRLQYDVNLFLACQTGFVPWEQLKSGFLWQSSSEVEGMIIGLMWNTTTPSRLS